MRDQFVRDEIVLDNALGFWVARVYAVSRQLMYRRFRAFGLSVTPEQWMVLVRLWEGEGRTQADLAALTLRDAPTVSRILDVMERDGWVERRSDPTDGRSRLVYLTDEGRGLRKRLVPAAREIVEESLRGIPEADLLTTRRTLQAIFANLGG